MFGPGALGGGFEAWGRAGVQQGNGGGRRDQLGAHRRQHKAKGSSGRAVQELGPRASMVKRRRDLGNGKDGSGAVKWVREALTIVEIRSRGRREQKLGP